MMHVFYIGHAATDRDRVVEEGAAEYNAQVGHGGWVESAPFESPDIEGV